MKTLPQINIQAEIKIKLNKWKRLWDWMALNHETIIAIATIASVFVAVVSTFLSLNIYNQTLNRSYLESRAYATIEMGVYEDNMLSYSIKNYGKTPATNLTYNANYITIKGLSVSPLSHTVETTSLSPDQNFLNLMSNLPSLEDISKIVIDVYYRDYLSFPRHSHAVYSVKDGRIFNESKTEN